MLSKFSMWFYKAIVAVTVILLVGTVAFSSITEAATSQAVLSSQNQAQQELEREQEKIHEQAARNDNMNIGSNHMIVSVASVMVESSVGMSKELILDLIPEAKKILVNVHELSKQIQMVNDNGALRIHADFKVAKTDGYDLVITVQELEAVHVNVNLANTGNDYTGNWRVTASYVNSNLTKKNDTFAIAYVTSPDHIENVKQVALSYRLPLPKTSDAFLVTASYSDVDLGTVNRYGGVYDLEAGGKSASVALHYQHTFACTAREKDILDVGLNYNRTENDYTLDLLALGTIPWENRYSTRTANVDFIHIDRGTHHVFTYDAGLKMSLANVRGNYQATGADDRYFLGTIGASYQYRLPKDWLAVARLNAQYTNNNLVPSEQIGAGGLYSVRGFSERAIAADTGCVASFELHTPEIVPHSRLFLFFDGAYLRNNNDFSQLRDSGISSWGIGYRYENLASGASFTVSYANIIDDLDAGPGSQVNHMRWGVRASFSF